MDLQSVQEKTRSTIQIIAMYDGNSIAIPERATHPAGWQHCKHGYVPCAKRNSDSFGPYVLMINANVRNPLPTIAL